MPSIFPEPTAGALVIRDVAGNPTGAPVERAYVPPATFSASCDLTALPSDCDVRFEPRQINAIVSELVALAECMDANGPWNCDSLNNLCAAFSAFRSTVVGVRGVIVSDTPPLNPGANQLWWESDTGFMFIWYDDGNSQQWVQVTSGAPPVLDKVSLPGAGTITDPIRVGLIDCGNW